jgi:hypothetical protein
VDVTTLIAIVRGEIVKVIPVVGSVHEDAVVEVDVVAVEVEHVIAVLAAVPPPHDVSQQAAARTATAWRNPGTLRMTNLGFKPKTIEFF